MWELIQFLIVGAVVMSNVHWQWTHNPCAAGFIGIGVAFSVTVTVTRLADTLRRVARWRKMADPFRQSWANVEARYRRQLGRSPISPSSRWRCRLFARDTRAEGYTAKVRTMVSRTAGVWKKGKATACVCCGLCPNA